MIALSAKRLMLWGSDGRIRIGSPDDGWDPIVRLPVTYAVSAASEGSGALISGSLHNPDGTETGVVLALAESGAILTEWRLDQAIFTWVATRPGERWAVARDRIWQLQSDGSLAPQGAVAPGSAVVLPAAGAAIVCTPADLTKAHAALPHCSRQGDRPWQAEGRWEHREQPPFLCGAWLVEPSRTGFAVRAIDSGRQVGALPMTPGTALVCADATGLIVARDRIRALELPTLKPRWEMRAPIAKVRVAVVQGSRLALLNDAGTVVAVDLARQVGRGR